MNSSPKNKNSVIIFSPSSSSKPVWISLFCRTQRKIFWRKFVTRLFWGTIHFHSRKKNTMEVNGAPELLCFPHSSEYLPLCSAEQRHSYRFGTTWGWENDDRIFIFGWTIPLNWSKVTIEQFLMLQKIYISNKCCSLELYIILKKMTVFINILTSTVFTIDDEKKYFLSSKSAY